MSLETKINDQIKVAMKAKNASALRAYRAIKAAILLAKTEDGAEEISDEKEVQLLSKMAKQRRDSIEIYQKQGREDLATVEIEELELIQEFLPAQLSSEEVKVVLEEIIQQTGASGPQDLGKVMGAAMGKLKGKADGKLISSLVKELLT